MLRYFPFALVVTLTALATLMASTDSDYLWAAAPLALLSLLGIHDLAQSDHSVLRNYPVIGHVRFFFEGIGPELRQYFFAGDTEEEPFNRQERSLIYQRSKNVEDKSPFGTKLDVYAENYAWLNHSIAPRHIEEASCRVPIGGPACRQPYLSSVLNISAMSFGALSGNAIRALNRGARMGNFAHDTGEGGISRHHRAEGGDLIFEIGTGYFGCRTPDGYFDADRFRERAVSDQVKMVEVKLSQGAKPGHGGILPAAKVTEEIAEARGVPMGQDVVSPACHSAFSTPLEMVEFLSQLRALSDGKPVGFKLCVGHRWEFLGIVKAMLETGIVPDFIVVDGKEGGTGAAPVEFANHIGTPLIEGLTFVQNALTGAGLRDQIAIGASGKVITAFDMVKVISLGADWVNSARAFMFSLGCIQSLRCHTNQCPTGVATQDPVRQRALDVEQKALRVCNYHDNTVEALMDVLAAAGLTSHTELRHHHFFVRDGDGVAHPAEERGSWLRPGELLETGGTGYMSRYWAMARSDSFLPTAE